MTAHGAFRYSFQQAWAALLFCCLGILSVGPAVAQSPCDVSPPSVLLLVGSEQFYLSGTFSDGHEDDVNATARPFGANCEDAGYLSFRDLDRVEAMVEVLNGCHVNDRYWVFMANTSSLDNIVTIERVATGESVSYTNASTVADVSSISCSTGARLSHGFEQGPQDLAAGSGPTALAEPEAVSALATESSETQDSSKASAPLVGLRESSQSSLLEIDASLAPSAGLRVEESRSEAHEVHHRASGPTASIHDGRFTVSVSWEDSVGATGTGTNFDPFLPKNAAAFYFHTSTSPNLYVNVVERCAAFAVEIGRLRDTGATITIVDEDFAITKTYTIEPGVSGNVFDPDAFPRIAGCLFGGDFERGDYFDWSTSSSPPIPRSGL